MVRKKGKKKKLSKKSAGYMEKQQETEKSPLQKPNSTNSPSFSSELAGQLKRWTNLKQNLYITSNERMARYLIDIYDNCVCRASEAAFVHEEDDFSSECGILNNINTETASVQVKAENLDEAVVATHSIDDANSDDESDPFNDVNNIFNDEECKLNSSDRNVTRKPGPSNDKKIIRHEIEKCHFRTMKCESQAAKEILNKDTLQVKLIDLNSPHKIKKDGDNEVNNSNNAEPLYESLTVKKRKAYRKIKKGFSNIDVGKIEKSLVSENSMTGLKTKSGRIAKRTRFLGDLIEDYTSDEEIVSKKYDYISKKKKDNDDEYIPKKKVHVDDYGCKSNDSDLEPEPGPKKYLCWKCNVELGSRKEVFKHVRVCIKDLDESNIYCDHCGNHYSTLSRMCEHRENISIVKPVNETCWKCKKHFTDENAWIYHFTECVGVFHEDTQRYTYHCSYCDKSCSTIQNFVTHSFSNNCKRFIDETNVLIDDDEKLGDDMYKCKSCSKTYKALGAFAVHKKSCIKLQCVDCLKVFKLPKSYNDHVESKMCLTKKITKYIQYLVELEYYFDEREGQMAMKTNKEFNLPDPPNVMVLKYRCKTCSKYFLKKEPFLKHENSCSKGEFKYACGNCFRFYRSRRQIMKHFEKMSCFDPTLRKELHGNTSTSKERDKEIKEQICDICGKTYTNMARLKSHKYDIHHQKSYPCNICGKVLARKTNLRYHIASVHEGNAQTYACQFCGKLFARGYQVNVHENVQHRGESNYRCSYCPKVCASGKDLRDHERIHTGEKPFKCRYCDKHFGKTCNRRVHEILIHTKQFRHYCEYCNKGFVARNARNAHMDKCNARGVEKAVYTKSPTQGKSKLWSTKNTKSHLLLKGTDEDCLKLESNEDVVDNSPNNVEIRWTSESNPMFDSPQNPLGQSSQHSQSSTQTSAATYDNHAHMTGVAQQEQSLLKIYSGCTHEIPQSQTSLPTAIPTTDHQSTAVITNAYPLGQFPSPSGLPPLAPLSYHPNVFPS